MLFWYWSNNGEVYSLKTIILFVGSIAIIYIGIQLIRSKGDTKDTQVDVTLPMSKVMLTCLLVTWANPQALIDGTLLLGGFKASLTVSASRYFISGVCIASATWFLSLATIVSLFKHVFTNKIIKIINVVCGSVLIYYGLKLGYSFITMISIK